MNNNNSDIWNALWLTELFIVLKLTDTLGFDTALFEPGLRTICIAFNKTTNTGHIFEAGSGIENITHPFGLIIIVIRHGMFNRIIGDKLFELAV